MVEYDRIFRPPFADVSERAARSTLLWREPELAWHA
jgi:hypothetical protein